jgi:hypothetical protein
LILTGAVDGPAVGVGVSATGAVDGVSATGDVVGVSPTSGPAEVVAVRGPRWDAITPPVTTATTPTTATRTISRPFLCFITRLLAAFHLRDKGFRGRTSSGPEE